MAIPAEFGVITRGSLFGIEEVGNVGLSGHIARMETSPGDDDKNKFQRPYHWAKIIILSALALSKILCVLPLVWNQFFIFYVLLFKSKYSSSFNRQLEDLISLVNGPEKT